MKASDKRNGDSERVAFGCFGVVVVVPILILLLLSLATSYTMQYFNYKYYLSSFEWGEVYINLFGTEKGFERAGPYSLTVSLLESGHKRTSFEVTSLRIESPPGFSKSLEPREARYSGTTHGKSEYIVSYRDLDVPYRSLTIKLSLEITFEDGSTTTEELVAEIATDYVEVHSNRIRDILIH